MGNPEDEKSLFFIVPSKKYKYVRLCKILYFFIIIFEVIATINGEPKDMVISSLVCYHSSTPFINLLVNILHGGCIVALYSMVKECMSTERFPMRKTWICLIVATCVQYTCFAFASFADASVSAYAIVFPTIFAPVFFAAAFGTVPTLIFEVTVLLRIISLIIICVIFLRYYSGRIKSTGYTIGLMLVLPILGCIIPIIPFLWLLAYSSGFAVLVCLLYPFFMHLSLFRTMVDIEDVIWE